MYVLFYSVWLDTLNFPCLTYVYTTRATIYSILALEVEKNAFADPTQLLAFIVHVLTSSTI